MWVMRWFDNEDGTFYGSPWDWSWVFKSSKGGIEVWRKVA